MGGWSDSNISGDKTENSTSDDFWIIKTDSLGNIQWQNTIGGNGNDGLASIAKHPMAGIFWEVLPIPTSLVTKLKIVLGTQIFGL